MNTKKPILVAADGWHRVSVSIKPELRPNLDLLVQLSGAKSLSALVAALAFDPQRARHILAPLVEQEQSRRDTANPARVRKKQIEEITRLIREGKVDPDVLARAVQAQKDSHD